MKNLFDTEAYNEMKSRLDALSPQSAREWGKMDVAQMLAHCKATFMVPLSDKKLPRSFVGRLLGWMVKPKLYNDIPWKKNLPTAGAFIVNGARNFDKEKQELINLVDTFYRAGPDGISKYPHPFFGSFTPEQWGQSMYKHLDHHLQQFSA